MALSGNGADSLIPFSNSDFSLHALGTIIGAPVIGNNGQMRFIARVGADAGSPSDSAESFAVYTSTLHPFDTTTIASYDRDWGLINRFGSDDPFDPNRGFPFPELKGIAPSGNTMERSTTTYEGSNRDNDLVVWSEVTGELARVAREGEQAPGVREGLTFAFDGLQNPEGDFGDGYLLENSSGQVAFPTRLNGGHPEEADHGIWTQDRAGVLRKVALQGDQIEVAPGDFRTIVEFGNPGYSLRGFSGLHQYSSFNDLGELVFAVTFSDDTSGVFVSDIAALPEPSSTVLLLIGMTALGSRRRRTLL